MEPSPHSQSSSNFQRTGKVTQSNILVAGHNFATKYETPHLKVFSDSDPQSTENEAESIEGFLCFIGSNLCPLQGTYPMTVYCLKDKAAMGSFLNELEGRVEDRNFRGCFLSEKNAFATFHGSGFGTWTHETMHKVLEKSVQDIDGWAYEGIPTLFEKIYGYPSSSGWNFVFGFQNPWRLKTLKDNWNSLTLGAIVLSPYASSGADQSEKRIVATFLNDSGKLERYIALARDGDKRGYDTYLEASFEKKLHELEPQFKTYLALIRSRWDSLMKIPISQYFFTETEYAQFLIDNKDSLNLIDEPADDNPPDTQIALDRTGKLPRKTAVGYGGGGDDSPRSEFKRVTDLMPPPFDHSAHRFYDSSIDIGALFSQIENDHQTVCIKIASQSRCSRSAMLIYRGRILGSVYNCKALPDTQSTLESIHLTMREVFLGENSISIYDLPESIVLPMSALFLGYPVPRNDDYVARAYLDYICGWFEQKETTACVLITMPHDNATCLVFIFKGKHSGAFHVQKQTFDIEKEFVYSMLKNDPKANVSATILPLEIISLPNPGLSLSIERKKIWDCGVNQSCNFGTFDSLNIAQRQPSSSP